MTALPPGWIDARLDELLAPEPAAITDGPFGSNLKTEHYTETGPRVIRLQNIGDGVFRDERAHISTERFEALKKHEVRAGDLVIAALGEVLPRACVVPAGVEPAIVKADCIRARLHPEINPHFINALLNSPPVRRAAASEISGVGRPRLNLAKIRSLRLRIPPRGEQDRIVAAIEEHLSRLDAGVELVTSAGTRLRLLAESAISAAINPDWPTKAVVDVCSAIVDCPHSTAKFQSDGIACVDTTNIEPFAVVKSRLRYVSEETYVSRTRRLEPAEDDVIFAREGTVGTAVRVPAGLRVCLGQRVMLLRAGPGLLPAFLELVMNSSFVRRQYQPMILGTTAPHLNVRDVKALQVPVPPEDEQVRAVEVADRALAATRRLMHELVIVRRRAGGLRGAVLADAYSGRLVAQDPMDESAADLLNRMAAERTTMSKSWRRQRT